MTVILQDNEIKKCDRANHCINKQMKYVLNYKPNTLFRRKGHVNNPIAL